MKHVRKFAPIFRNFGLFQLFFWWCQSQYTAAKVSNFKMFNQNVLEWRISLYGAFFRNIHQNSFISIVKWEQKREKINIWTETWINLIAVAVSIEFLSVHQAVLVLRLRFGAVMNCFCYVCDSVQTISSCITRSYTHAQSHASAAYNVTEMPWICFRCALCPRTVNVFESMEDS